MNQQPVSVRRAIWTGRAVVTAPFTVALLAGVGFYYVYVNTLPAGVLLTVGLLLPLAFGWLWWSVAAPLWRVWALERVEDWETLLIEAVKVGLVPPQNHWIERTEIKSRRTKERERNLGW